MAADRNQAVPGIGLAVALTLISGAVGVYYFEQSGDLNYQIQTETVPALEASWSAARETERLLNLGLSIAARPDSERYIAKFTAPTRRSAKCPKNDHGAPTTGNRTCGIQWVSALLTWYGASTTGPYGPPVRRCSDFHAARGHRCL